MLTKVTYYENSTLIHAQNMNDIQDEIIANAGDIAEIQEDVSDIQAVIEAPTTDGTYVLKVTVEDGEATFSWVAEESNAEEET